MADKNQVPLKTPAPVTTYNDQTGGSHMDIYPLDPRQGQVIDLTKPHALDEVLPPPGKPGLNLPEISELNKAYPQRYKLDTSGPDIKEYQARKQVKRQT